MLDENSGKREELGEGLGKKEEGVKTKGEEIDRGQGV